jgi:hypothetical protein
MTIKHLFASVLASGLISAGAALAPTAVHPAYAACDPGTHVDNTTADTARRIMLRAGFTDVQVEQKGCDNVWHVIANKNGQLGRYAIEPGGRIYPEGN